MCITRVWYGKKYRYTGQFSDPLIKFLNIGQGEYGVCVRESVCVSNHLAHSDMQLRLKALE